ncbi:putative uncharacterized protein ZNRD1-AS1 [Pipistrellus kuhlii]|uniref:Uncharacterized protein n=1 Tax=Pipistrellus kuhlii TaxID=59472 RepID=A0A7J7RGD5_PIPKU|nr:putative uncharacterized protein ZNRD1-AS1 [Pipistrellus kuhlii]XP_036278895.1 putative uncharacterized protein ZNRD1-AS1 [Pipistrellus kuhlii]KAF6275231.1 hypothetical protein mPipKuh1_019455 [Pipistrellus kuhlii]
MLEDAWEYIMVPKEDLDTKGEENRIQTEKSDGAKRWDYLVSEKELDQIKKHIHRAERARGLRDHKYQLLPQKSPREILTPRTFTLEDEQTENIQRRPKAKTRQHQVAWVQEQMQRHRDRMIRGREFTEQRSKKREAQKLGAQAPPSLKPQVRKEEVKEFKRVTAYPLIQPPLEVTILMQKSGGESSSKKPLRRQLLRIPPFLRSQLENKIKAF